MIDFIGTYIKNFQNVEDNYAALQNYIQIEKLPVILEAGINIDSNLNCTVLMKTIKSLELPRHTLGFAMLLRIQSHNLPDNLGNIYLSLFNDLLLQGDKRIMHLVSKQVTEISELSLKLATKRNEAMTLIKPLIIGSEMLSKSEHELNPLHSHVLQACLSSNQYHVGEDFFNKNEILMIDPRSSNLQSADYLAYFYYGGLCFIGSRNLSSALNCFNEVITTPAQVVSSIVVATLKTASLISLLEKGKKYQVPKSVSLAIISYYKDELELYHSISKLYVENESIKLSEKIMNYAEELRNDHLLGIAKQLPQALIINRVQNCLKSYSSINLEKLTKYAQVSTITETENILVSHFDNIRIDKENNIVYVVTDSTRLPISTSTLSNSLKLLRSTYDQVENLRQKLITSPKYIQQSSGEFHI